MTLNMTTIFSFQTTIRSEQLPKLSLFFFCFFFFWLSVGRVVQSVARLTQEPEFSGSIPGPDTYFNFSSQ